jgi:hypothetical protein
MTLNQQYKNSGSKKSFKEWVFEQQENGQIDLNQFNSKEDLQTMKYSADGKDKEVGISIFGVPLLYIGIGIVVLVGGIYAYKKMSK